MYEGKRTEEWKQTTWLRAGMNMRAHDAAELNIWNPLFEREPEESQQTDGQLHRSIGRALAKRKR
jgi:hypothetical protein